MNIKEVFNPKSIEEALELLDKYKDKAKIIAGGTDVVIALKEGKFDPDVLINIFKIEEMKDIKEENGEIVIGACVTYTDIVESDLFDKNLIGFNKACRLVGSPQIRNKGTIGGNIANKASAADSVPPLLTLEASLTLESKDEKREITLEEYLKDGLKANELLSFIKFKKPVENGILTFSKLGLRKALAISRLTNSVYIEEDEDNNIKSVRIASGALGKTPIREKAVEEYLMNKKIEEETIKESINILRNSAEERLKGRSTFPYKSSAIETILRRALEESVKVREELKR